MRVTDRGFCYSKLTLLSYFSPHRNIYLNKFTYNIINYNTLICFVFCFLASVFFFVEYLCLLLSFCFIPWLIFPTYRVFLKIIITNVGFFSSFSHSALKKLIRNFFLPYFHKKNKISCCCLLTCFFLNLQATFFLFQPRYHVLAEGTRRKRALAREVYLKNF